MHAKRRWATVGEPGGLAFEAAVAPVEVVASTGLAGPVVRVLVDAPIAPRLEPVDHGWGGLLGRVKVLRVSQGDEADQREALRQARQLVAHDPNELKGDPNIG